MASIAYSFVSIAVLLSSVALISCHLPDDDPYRLGKFPYIVQLSTHYKNGIEVNPAICAGSIVSKTFVLTAANCNPKYEHHESGYGELILTVRVVNDTQKVSGKVYKTKSFITHPEFNGTGNSVALVELAVPIQFSEFVKPIQLGREPLMEDEFVSALGFLDNFFCVNCHLRHGIAVTASNLYCEKLFGIFHIREFFGKPIPITIKTICTNGNKFSSMINQGNIGAPLVQKDALVGVLAWYGKSQYPNEYLRVSEYADWIENTISA